jgi:hypothetical protein
VSDQPPQVAFPFGTVLLLAAVFALYVAMLGTTSFSTGIGDASFGQAMASLFFTVGLWIALILLLVNGALMGEMPRWAVFIAVFLVPFSAAATFAAIDMCSRHIKWAIVFPVVLPLLIALYAVWARTPKLRGKLAIELMSAGVWALVLVLSGAALLTASII